MLGFDAVKQFVFPLISQTGIAYRHSSLSLCGEGLDVEAGDRMPYFMIEGKSVYDWLHAPAFHLLLFSDAQSDNRTIINQIELEYGGLIDCASLPLSARVAKTFGTKKPFAVLLRPDNYIGCISSGDCLADLRTYFTNAIGHERTRDQEKDHTNFLPLTTNKRSQEDHHESLSHTVSL
jgi:hypothetical protein